MRIVYFTHSLASCWNHGNAHFLRGVLDELIARGHDARAYEPAGAWSRANLVADHGRAGLAAFADAYPRLHPQIYAEDADPEALVEGADLVIVHEWNAPELVARLGTLRQRGARFRLLFHDTHHRAVSAPEEMRAYDLSGYDGVLAFGETLAEVYRGSGWGKRVHVWHEAADLRRFHPPAEERAREGLVWIGNWGDGERSDELAEFLLRPAAAVGMPLDIYGVRYPDAALAMLERYGAHYRGWAANPTAPAIYARHTATVHVPRRFYAEQLPGIPTIRVFEALACGIPLICAPWDDAEGLFRPGTDYLVARDGEEMTACLADLAADPSMGAELAAQGFATIAARHTCAHRVDELLALVGTSAAPASPRTPEPA
ncbi:MAG: glycosyltransferase [Porphyrobacter sp.]|nr:glycosyltransferase [Porphyrobacter sp.]